MPAPSIRPQRSPALSLPMPYFGAGMVAFVLLAAGVPLGATALLQGNDDPRVFALTHLAVLGWVTMTIMGALYQLLPVALGAEIRSVRLGRWNFYLYAAGVAGFVPSFYFNWTPGVAAFGTAAAVGILHFAANLLLSYRSVRIWHPMAAYVLAGLAWLLVTIGFGLAWALDWQFQRFDITPAMLAAHAQAGLAGWLGCTLMGVSYKLMELFALAHRPRWRLAFANLGLWNLALAGLVVSLIAGPMVPGVRLFAILLAASVAVFVGDLGRLWARRRRRPVTLEQVHVAVSAASILVAGGLGVTLAWGLRVPPAWTVAYGYAAVVGGFGFAIVGRYYKIVPFLVWLHRYSGAAGTAPLPLLRDLWNPRLGAASFGLLTTGYAGVLAGLLAGQVALVRWGGVVYLMGAVACAAGIGWVLVPGRPVSRSGRAPAAGARHEAGPAER